MNGPSIHPLSEALANNAAVASVREVMSAFEEEHRGFWAQSTCCDGRNDHHYPKKWGQLRCQSAASPSAASCLFTIGCAGSGVRVRSV